jgi:hypothetical protein
MKTTLLILAISLAAIFGFANTSFAQLSGNTFQVVNLSTQNVGEVTIGTPGGNYYVNAPAQSTDTVSIADTASSVTINGMTDPNGQKALVQLANGNFIVVMWTGPNNIVIVDEEEIL